ncbi:MAG TPA: alpha/beta fold hydrolase, partial [Aquihabitans sp.]|nr:alpha/beta fold hydrolase [Aquihabitans sp.]
MTTNHTSPTTPPADRTTHRVPTPDGRTIAVDVRGPADGPTVVLLQSAPGSRRFDPDPDATAAAGVRLVTFDRAGYGDSTALPATTVPTIVGHAQDAAAVVASLDVGPVDVVGWSAGGRVAAALAVTHPHLVRSVAIVATPAPDDEVP